MNDTLAPYPATEPFAVFHTHNPPGYNPGYYYFVVHTGTGNKVTRYLRRPRTAMRKAEKYALWYDQGDRYWPEVDRCDELRTNPDVRPTLWERFVAGLGGLPVWMCGV